MNSNKLFFQCVFALACVANAATPEEPKKVSRERLLTGVFTYTHIHAVDAKCIEGFESEAVMEMVSEAKAGGNEGLLLPALRRAITDLKLSNEALKAARDQLYAELTATDVDIRLLALPLVVDLDGKKATDVLLRAVDDRDLGVQATALSLLEKFGDTNSIDRLEGILIVRDAKRNTPQALPEGLHFKTEAAKALEGLRERAAKERAGKKP